MKTILRIGLFLVAITLMLCKSTAVDEEEDSVIAAKEKNEKASIDESVSDFLTEAADSRMMGIAQGELAAERGTTEQIRKYGELMVRDQRRLLEGIRDVAKSKNVALPKTISYEKEHALASLREKNGADFDKKFVQMIIIDHRRDVRKFRNAISITDPDVAGFASRNLLTIEAHLEQAKAIKTDM